MILNNALTLTKPILGCKVTSGRPRQLLRDSRGNPGLVEPVWRESFSSAASALGIDFKADMVTFPSGYEANKYSEFVRAYSKFKKERFESIPKGARITFEVILNENILRPEDYAKILAVVGTEFGISQFGNKFGFGRFNIEHVKRKKLSVSLGDFDFDV